MEYAIVGSPPEVVIARFEGPADQVAYNRSVLRTALETLQVVSLLTRPLDRPLESAEAGWRSLRFPVPSSPEIVLPDRWNEDGGGPLPCQGLPPPIAAVATSPPGDFTVALRASFRDEPASPETAARACSAAPGKHGARSYRTSVEWLGIHYVAEGVFVPRAGGLLQLELLAPREKLGFMNAFYRFWVELNSKQ